MWSRWSLNELHFFFMFWILLKFWNTIWITFSSQNENVAEHLVPFYFSLSSSWVVASFEKRESHQESTCFLLIFWKGPFWNTDAAPSFHLWCFLTSLESGRDVRHARGMTAGASPSTCGCLVRTHWGFCSLFTVSLSEWLPGSSLHEAQVEWQTRVALPPPVSRTCGWTALWERSGHPSSWPLEGGNFKVKEPVQ